MRAPPFIAALCRGGIENRELAFELVCGAVFWCNRHCRTSPVVLEGLWGQAWPKIGRKPTRRLRIENQQSAAVSISQRRMFMTAHDLFADFVWMLLANCA